MVFTSGLSVRPTHNSSSKTSNSQPLARQHSPKEDSWWPKHQTWSGSGLDFGAWAPIDEDWYTSRNAHLNTHAASCVRAKEWKVRIKYQKKEARRFLIGARSLAEKFIEERHL